MNKKNLIIIILSISSICFLVLSIYLYTEVPPKLKDEKTILLDSIAVSDNEVFAKDQSTFISDEEALDTLLTVKEKINICLEDFYEYCGIFKGENFDENRYLMASNYIDIDYQGTKCFFFSNYLNNLRNKPEKIIEAYEEHKLLFFQLISLRTYKMSNIDKIVKGLLISYQDLNANDLGFDNRLDLIYKIMNDKSTYEKDASELYDKIALYIDSESLLQIEEIRLSSGKQFSDGDIVWFYSFWARRNKEGNVSQTLTIINDIKSNYENLE